jgi:hypothetical protein
MSSLTREIIEERTGLKVKFKTEEQLYALLDLLTELLPKRVAAAEAADADAAEAEKPKKVKKAKKAAATSDADSDLLAPVDASAATGDVPTLGATDSLRFNKYRLATLDAAHCVGRKIDEANTIVGTCPGDDGANGKVFPEIQCSKKPIPGSRLCAVCAKNEAEYLANPSKTGRWRGRLDEPLFHRSFVVGCDWFWSKYPEGIEGARRPADDSASSTAAEKPKKVKKAKAVETAPAPAPAEAEAAVEAEPIAETEPVAEKPKKVKKAKAVETAPAPAEPVAEAATEAEPVAEKPKKVKKAKAVEPAPAPAPAPAEAETDSTSDAEAAAPVAKPVRKASVAVAGASKDVEWVTFISDGVVLIRHTKTGNVYQCDRSKHRLEDMVLRDKHEGKWRDGRLDPYADEDDE